MKKLLILTLVLGMASLANAGIVVDIQVGGSTVIEVEPSDVVDIFIGNDAPAAGGTGNLVMNVSLAQSGSGSAVTLGTWMLLPSPVATITTVGDGLKFAFGNGSIGMNVVGNWLKATFTVPADAEPGIDTVDLTWSGTIFLLTPAADSVPVVPEPMTIALLGLGGLFLLRRRK